jgi:hypothetical protein
MSYPSFSVGEVLTAADMNAVGLWLVKTQTVPANQTSIVVNSAFSADYENYRITYTGGTSSVTPVDISLQLNGATGNNYDVMLFYAVYGATAVSVAGSTTSSYSWAGGGQTSGATVMVDLLKPFLAQPTLISSQFWGGGVGWAQGRHTLSNSYTGFTLIINGGNVSGGTIRVYGYRN